MINNPIIYKFFKNFTNHRKNTNRANFLAAELFSTFLSSGTTVTFQNLENKTPSDIYLKFQLVCMKVQAHNSWETPLESRLVLNHLGNYRNILQFQISTRKKTWYRDTWVLKIRVLRKIFTKQFCFIWCRRQHLWATE